MSLWFVLVASEISQPLEAFHVFFVVTSGWKMQKKLVRENTLIKVGNQGKKPFSTYATYFCMELFLVTPAGPPSLAYVSTTTDVSSSLQCT